MEKLPRVEVIIGDSRQAPECPHGPTLLFKRIVDEKERLFYACSACRDRKDCRFFLWADEEMPEEKKKSWALEKQRVLPKIDHSKLFLKFMKISQSSGNRMYCHSCSELITPQDLDKHPAHEVAANVTDYQFAHPSEFLKPLENAKKEAQYLFSKQSTKTVVTALKKLGIKHVLCIGAPRIHEYVLSETSLNMDSILLDIDARYHNFHGPLQFCWFNAFNNHYFNGKESMQVVSDFLQQDSGKDIAIVMDPPFGGRVEPLADTIQRLTAKHQSLNPEAGHTLQVMWMFPYFMEPHILSSLPDYTMLDYKVDYVNHPLFTVGPKGRKFGSPVRIFTNIPSQKVPLPMEEGYRYCKPCRRWVCKENNHCRKCATCPSKDGRTYIHCDVCERCVKPSWTHCDVCQRCCQQSHKCGVFKPSNLCYICGEAGHKKTDCEKGTNVKKRKTEDDGGRPTKARKGNSDAKKDTKVKKKGKKVRGGNKKMKKKIQV